MSPLPHLRALAGFLAITLWLHALPADAAERRVLFFALDAIPYDLVAELTDPARGEAALFADLGPPVPIISSFPSTSSVAFAGILEPFGLGKPPGYEARFFDRQENRVRGGGLVSYHQIEFSWRTFFVWRYGNPIRRAFATAVPVSSSVAEVEWDLERFLESDEEVFFTYVATTDGAAHLKGAESLTATLEALDRGLERLRREHPDLQLTTVIFSDHGIAGGEPLKNVRRGVRQALQEAGFELGGRLESDSAAVIVPFGLVSSLEVYTRPGRELSASQAVAQVEGVDLCAAPTSGGWRVDGPHGGALIGRRLRDGKSEWMYRPLDGDPLGFSPLLAELRRRQGDPNALWFPDDWWFEATRTSPYPDALYRLARSFELVRNPASVVCSLDDGYMYGAFKTEFGALLSGGALRWTHGALSRQATLGFLLTDWPGWKAPSALRFDRSLLPFTRAGALAAPTPTGAGTENGGEGD